MLKHSISAALFLAFAAVAQAEASVTYRFFQTSSTPADLDVEISITFADATTHAVGERLPQSIHTGSLAGIEDFSFSVDSKTIALTDLQVLFADCQPGDTGRCFGALRFDLTPETGFVFYDDASQTLGFSYANGLLSGDFSTDDFVPVACGTAGFCNYAGVWSIVPEPASITLLAASLLPLFPLTRTRRRSPAPGGYAGR